VTPYPSQKPLWAIYSHDFSGQLCKEGVYYTAWGVWGHKLDPSRAYKVSCAGNVFSYGKFLSRLISLRTVERNHHRGLPYFT
jgi:hypothetical protein